jgi:hypothetical protein
MYITKWAGFDIYKMVAATLLFEGSLGRLYLDVLLCVCISAACLLWVVSLSRVPSRATPVFSFTLHTKHRVADVAAQQEKIYALALKHGGVKGGEENGKKGYNLTYFIAYLRGTCSPLRVRSVCRAGCCSVCVQCSVCTGECICV